jgi:DNA-directed RNA polymerase subunit L
MSAGERSPLNSRETGHEAQNATTMYSKTVRTVQPEEKARRASEVAVAGLIRFVEYNQEHPYNDLTNFGMDRTTNGERSGAAYSVLLLGAFKKAF